LQEDIDRLFPLKASLKASLKALLTQHPIIDSLLLTNPRGE
jgi:hypothetical protein